MTDSSRDDAVAATSLHTCSVQQSLPFGGSPSPATGGRRESDQTRRDAYATAKPKVSGRSLRALAYLQRCGATGATREEIGIAIGIVHHGVSSITGPLIKLGLALETSRRRDTSTGASAVVLVAIAFADNAGSTDA